MTSVARPPRSANYGMREKTKTQNRSARAGQRSCRSPNATVGRNSGERGVNPLEPLRRLIKRLCRPRHGRPPRYLHSLALSRSSLAHAPGRCFRLRAYSWICRFCAAVHLMTNAAVMRSSGFISGRPRATFVFFAPIRGAPRNVFFNKLFFGSTKNSLSLFSLSVTIATDRTSLLGSLTAVDIRPETRI